MLQDQNTGLFPYLLIEFEGNGPNHAISKTFLLEYLMVDKKTATSISYSTLCVLEITLCWSQDIFTLFTSGLSNVRFVGAIGNDMNCFSTLIDTIRALKSDQVHFLV